MVGVDKSGKQAMARAGGESAGASGKGREEECGRSGSHSLAHHWRWHPRGVAIVVAAAVMVTTTGASGRTGVGVEGGQTRTAMDGGRILRIFRVGFIRFLPTSEKDWSKD